MSLPPDQRVSALLRATLDEAGIAHEPGTRAGEVVATLPGEHKLRTTVSLTVGDHSLSAAAFVIRAPDENGEAVHRWLLRRNLALRGIAFAIGADGDVYLVGHLPLAAVTANSIDALLGSVLEAADSSFDPLLALGFATSIRREWAWRTSRGESTRNLDRFQHLLAAEPPG